MSATTVATMVATTAAGAATADAVQAARSHLGGPGDCRLGRWCLAGYGRRRRFADLHPGPVGRRRCRAMTMQATQTPTHSVADGSVDRDSAFTVLIVLGFGAVFVAVWPMLAVSLSGSPYRLRGRVLKSWRHRDGIQDSQVSGTGGSRNIGGAAVLSHLTSG